MADRNSESETDYLVRRARDERELAAKSDDLNAALIHRQLASEYERRAGYRFETGNLAAR